jgi:sugar O-acyltransferase (sialic acid O-acetyltransferase NeuD family)
MQNLVIVGAGKLSIEVVQLLEENCDLESGYTILGHYVEDKFVDNPNSLKLLSGIDLNKNRKDLKFIFAIGDPVARWRIYENLQIENDGLVSIIHPKAIVSASAKIESGSIIFPGSYVGSNTRIRKLSIIYYGALISHDCTIDESVNVSPGACLAGGVTVGAKTLLGINSTILPNIKLLGENIVGAGAVVTGNVRFGERVIGNPASPLL